MTSQPNANFTIPANSTIHYGILPDESIVSTANIPTPPAIPGRFEGLPSSPDCAFIHPDLPDEMWVLQNGNIHYYSIQTETKIREATTISSVFPEVSGSVQFTHRLGNKGVNSNGDNVFWQISIYNSNTDYFKYEFVNGAFVYLASANRSWLQYTASGEGWKLNFKDDNGVQKVDAAGNTGNFQPYGQGTASYPTLPNTSPVNAVVNDQVNNRIIAMIDSTMYILSGSPSNSVTDSWTYG